MTPTIKPTVTADELATPVEQPKLTPPQQGTIPASLSGVVSSVREQGNQLIQAQTEEAQQLAQLRKQQASFANEGTLSDLYNDLSTQYQLPDNMKQLQDIQLQLSDNKTQSELTKTRIASGPGQTLQQGQREITQEDREQAVRDAGLAARAAVLQGNIETASSLVNQAVQLAYQDRTLRNQNILNQINDLRGTVDQQTQQLLDQEQRKYEEDQAQVERIQSAVDAAMASGAATQQDIAQLTDPRVSDDQRLALAQSISARGAAEDRSLDQQAKRASISNANLGWAKFEYDKLNDKALSGDPDAIDKLGFDPRASGGNFEAETDLRKEFNALKPIQAAQEVQQSYGQIQAAYNQAIQASNDGTSKAAADQALIISFNKMLDPGSVVREGEFARSTEGQSLINQYKAKAEQVISGGAGLTDSERSAIVDMTQRLYSDYIQLSNDKAYEYRQNALRQGGNPDYVAGYMDTVISPDQAEPGAVVIINGQPLLKEADGTFTALDI